MKELVIALSKAEEGMQISRDIISEEGIFLVPKDTYLTLPILEKLKFNNIYDFRIYQADDSDTSTVLVAQMPEFIAFSQKYDEQAAQIKDIFSNITDGSSVEADALYRSVDHFMSEYTHMSDIFTYLCRIESFDDVTYTHAINVSILANIFSKWLHMDEADTRNLTLAGLLHDIGKLKVDAALIKKPGTLSDEEFAEVKNHSLLGYRLLHDADLDPGIKNAVLLHHEKANGSGYPLGLFQEKVHPYARIIAIVDIYDAMTSERPYHKRQHPFEAIRYLEQDCFGTLDPAYLHVFLDNIARNYLGNDVRLTNGAQGKIVFINPHSPSRPIVQAGTRFIDLMTSTNIDIAAFL